MSAIRVTSRSKIPTAAVIIFHGLGDTGNGWKFLSDLTRQSSDFDHINFVFPNAPEIPITVNGGYRMPGWFDIFQLENITRVDTEGFTKTLGLLDSFVEEQIKLGVKSENIIVGGFSQGGGLALGELVKSDKKLGGILALSPFIPFHDLLKTWSSNDVNKATPVFHGHGEADPLIPLKDSDNNHKFFTQTLGFTNYTYKTYPGVQHGVNNDEISDILDFIRKTIPGR